MAQDFSTKANIIQIYGSGMPIRQGAKYPTSTADGTAGSYTISSTSFVQQEGVNNASGALTGTSIVRFQYLDNTTFGFSVPSTATITGVVVEISRHANQNTSLKYITDNIVQLIKSGTAQGNNKADTVTQWVTTQYQIITYGSSTDLWGITLTPAEVNASNFGVRFTPQGRSDNFSNTVSADIDFIRIVVYYTDGGTSIKASITPRPPSNAKGNIIRSNETASSSTMASLALVGIEVPDSVKNVTIGDSAQPGVFTATKENASDPYLDSMGLVSTENFDFTSVTVSTQQDTTSDTTVDVAGMSIDFTLDRAKNMFFFTTVTGLNTSGGGVIVLMYLDGVQIGTAIIVPGSLSYNGSVGSAGSGTFDAHSHNSIFGTTGSCQLIQLVSEGAHQVKLVYNTMTTGTLARLTSNPRIMGYIILGD